MAILKVAWAVHDHLVHEVVWWLTPGSLEVTPTRQDRTLVYICTATLRGALFVDIAKERMCGVQGAAAGALCGSNLSSLMPKQGSSLLQYLCCLDLVYFWVGSQVLRWCVGWCEAAVAPSRHHAVLTSPSSTCSMSPVHTPSPALYLPQLPCPLHHILPCFVLFVDLCCHHVTSTS